MLHSRPVVGFQSSLIYDGTLTPLNLTPGGNCFPPVFDLQRLGSGFQSLVCLVTSHWCILFLLYMYSPLPPRSLINGILMRSPSQMLGPDLASSVHQAA